MHPDFTYWRKRCATLNLQDPLVRWLMIHGGTVFMGSKSGELLALDRTAFSLRRDQIVATVADLTQSWGLRFQILRETPERLQLVVYDGERVDADLAEIPLWALDKIGFPGTPDATEFYAEIGRRWAGTGTLPDAIGFGLGYPAKDVLGFMGLVEMDHTGECGWRVYGDPVPSYERGREFARARALACACVA